MAHAAMKMTTALTTGLLAAAATSITSESPPREYAPAVQPVVQASSMVSAPAPAIPNSLFAAIAEVPAASSFAASDTFVAAEGAVTPSRNTLATNLFHTTTNHPACLLYTSPSPRDS